jgi:hypothetical protein
MTTIKARLSFEHFKKSLKEIFQAELDLVNDAGTLYGPRWKKAHERYTAFKQRHPEHAARISTREEQIKLHADRLSSSELKMLFYPSEEN